MLIADCAEYYRRLDSATRFVRLRSIIEPTSNAAAAAAVDRLRGRDASSVCESRSIVVVNNSRLTVARRSSGWTEITGPDVDGR